MKVYSNCISPKCSKSAQKMVYLFICVKIVEFHIEFAIVSQDQITITGYEHKAIAARDAIQAIVDELEEMISEDITLDNRVHARIIGARGKGIRKIMDEFKVKMMHWHQPIAHSVVAVPF